MFLAIIKGTVMSNACDREHFSRQTGFTLIEMMVVICIIAVLASALTVSVRSGYKQARQASCKANLRQFGVGLTIYRGEHENRVPDWISNLYPDYVDARGMYVCQADDNQGKDTPRPLRLVEIKKAKNETDTSPFWDNEKNSDATRNKTVECCSYLYEFSHAKAPSSWWSSVAWPGGQKPGGSLTMGQYKTAQMQYGDDSSKVTGVYVPYSASRIPIIRCYHHWRDQMIWGYNDAKAKESGRATRQYITLNVAYAGNVFTGPLYWEGTIHPGETVK